jgi:hypothetical protein
MYTLDHLTKNLHTLEEAFRTIDDFDSLSVKQIFGAHVYYTDGEAQGALAVLTICRKNPKYVSGCLDALAVQYCNMYIFPDGKILSHFMKSDDSYTTTAEYVKATGIWLAILA